MPSPEPHPANRFLSDSGGREGRVEENRGVFEEDFALVNLRCPVSSVIINTCKVEHNLKENKMSLLCTSHEQI